MLTEEMLSYIEDHSQEAYELLLTLARIPSPSNYEERRARFCLRWLEAQGARGVYMDEALNVVYPVDVSEGGPVEVFMAHTDVVFPDEEELPLRVEEGRIYCPGVGDDTACLVCILLIGKYIAEHAGTGEWNELRRRRGQGAPGLVLVCNSGEEGLGNLKGVRKICQTYGDRIQAFCTFDSTLDKLVDTAVGSRRYRVTVDARGGHSYNDFGCDNAIAGLASVIDRLYRLSTPEGGKTTYNVGLISGGTSVNTIASHAEMLYEFRSDCGEHLDYMERQFRQVLAQAGGGGLKVDCVLICERPCEGGVDPLKAKALLDRAVRAVTAATGQIPHCGPGSTDCNIPLSLGIPSVCVGSYRGAGAHTRGEYVEIDSLREGYRAAFEMVLGSP